MAPAINKAKSNLKKIEDDNNSGDDSDSPVMRRKLRDRKAPEKANEKTIKSQSSAKIAKTKSLNVVQPEKKGKATNDVTSAVPLRRSTRGKSIQVSPEKIEVTALKKRSTRRRQSSSSDSDDGFKGNDFSMVSPDGMANPSSVSSSPDTPSETVMAKRKKVPSPVPEVQTDDIQIQSDKYRSYKFKEKKRSHVAMKVCRTVEAQRLYEKRLEEAYGAEMLNSDSEHIYIKLDRVESSQQRSSRLSIGQKVLDCAEGSKQMLGYHVSASGGIEKAIYNATAEGCRAFALFLRNQRQWYAKPLESYDVECWMFAIKKMKYPLDLIVPHGSYLMNPGSPDAEKLKKTREAMLDECTRAQMLGIKWYNFHPGSTTGSCTVEECIKTAADTINLIIDRTEGVTLVIETMAGSGHTIGGTFEEIRKIIDNVKNQERVGVCIDTCHIFAAGYDIRTKKAYKKTMEKFDEIIGFKFLKALHINDSKGELGSKLDRHEHLGLGKIGKDAFSFIMNDERLRGLPMILETPDGRYVEEMKMMYDMEDK